MWSEFRRNPGWTIRLRGIFEIGLTFFTIRDATLSRISIATGADSAESPLDIHASFRSKPTPRPLRVPRQHLPFTRRRDHFSQIRRG